jgi:diguanylate cyclase (GGDEF)-like protein/PAS domain S-box-containing protein
MKINKKQTTVQSMEQSLQIATLTSLFDSIPALIFAKDLNLRYTHCNKSFLKYFGVEIENLIGKTDAESLSAPEEILHKHSEIDRKVINEGKVITVEEEIPDIHGIKRMHELTKAPLFLNGEIAGVIGTSINITERKRTEHELTMQTATLTTLFDSVPDLIFIKDLESRYVQCNKSLAKHFGITKEFLIGKDDIEGLGMPEDVAEDFKEWDLRVIYEQQPYFFEEHVPHIDGSNPLFETVKAPLIVDGKTFGILGISHEVTKYKEMEEAALTASRLKSEFLAQMSHEIRTPMNSIVGFSELALDSHASPKIRNYLNNILNNSHWLLQIINNILDLSKIESGKIELENIPFCPQKLLESCRTMFTPKTEEKGLELDLYAEIPSGKKMLQGDPTKIFQIFVNLLSNAVKFTNAGKISLRTTVKEQKENSIIMLVEVKDTGIGMTPEQAAKIYDPFKQAELETARKYGGTGLGLPIAKGLVEMMGGKLQVESKLDIGSRFSFELVLDLIDEAENKKENELITDKLKKPIFKGEVLLCEDNIMNQQVISEHLTRVGLKTIVADNGEIGVDLVKNRIENNEKQFDIIFMDIQMPVMDGLEAASKILELNINVPIIAVTANIMLHDKETYKKSGMEDHIGKPFTSVELWKCLARYLPVESYAETNIEKKMPESKPVQEVDLTENESKQHSILIVDDEKLNIVALTDILKSNYKIYAVIDSREAAKVAEENMPDIILLDIIMPEMDGYSVIKALHDSEKTRGIPVVFITGLDSIEDEEKGLAHGAVDYISKPFHPPIVKLRVQHQIKILEQYRVIKHMSMHDALTKLANRRGFEACMTMEWNRTSREKMPISVLLLDIDYFKKYNDTYGHGQGDIALTAVASTFASVFKRSGDVAARWGGEEFIILLPNTDKDGALEVAEQIRSSVENMEIPMLNQPGEITKVTVSIGVNTKLHGEVTTIDEFISKADNALYQAKNEGRNRVCSYEEQETTS